MKKTILIIAVAFFMFCIVPISTTQAITQNTESKSRIAFEQTNTTVSILESRDMTTELNNPELKDNVVTYDMQELRGVTIARGGSRPIGNKNPYVKRQGYGESTMGDDYIEEDENGGEDEEDEEEEDLDFGDDSAVEYNTDL